MKSKEFFDLAVKMRYVQKHYYLSTDKETRKPGVEPARLTRRKWMMR